jgi:hypothetical protein
VSLWFLAARQRDQVGFVLAIQDAPLGPLRLGTPRKRFLEPMLDKALAHALDRRESHFERPLDLLIWLGWTCFAAISLQQDLSMHNLARWCYSASDQVFQCLTLLFA